MLQWGDLASHVGARKVCSIPTWDAMRAAWCLCWARACSASWADRWAASRAAVASLPSVSFVQLASCLASARSFSRCSQRLLRSSAELSAALSWRARASASLEAACCACPASWAAVLPASAASCSSCCAALAFSCASLRRCSSDAFFYSSLWHTQHPDCQQPSQWDLC